ncbi:MAG: S8 family serine peptidase, partial [Chloroflexota bacterium]
MNDQTTSDGKPSDTITLKRGKKTVTYEKVRDKFAVRLRAGRARNEEQLQEAVGEVKTAVAHVDADQVDDLDLFTVAEPTRLEETMDEMREAPAADVVTHVYQVDDTPGGAMVPTGTLTVQFKPGIPEARQLDILGEYGLDVVESLEFLPNGYTVRLTAASTENPLKIAAKLQQRDEIETAEPDLSFEVELKYAPTDTLYGEQWHLRNRGNRIGLVPGADVKAEGAWEFTRGTRDIVVCVMDDGFDLTHPKLNAPGKVVAPRDFGGNDDDPNPVFFEDNHGTACTGVAVAEETGIGVVGLAPGCAFMPVRMGTRLSDNAVVALFQHAMDNGADVIS